MASTDKKVSYSDWMGDDDESDQGDTAFAQDRFEGLEGHMRLQLEKTYGGDDRFKLTEDFDVSLKDANKGHAHVPDQMLGALSKTEFTHFFNKDAAQDGEAIPKNTGGYDSLEDEAAGEVQWEHGIDVDGEKDRALNILASVVPANEVFLTSSKQQNSKAGSSLQSSSLDKLVGKGDASGTKKRAMHIKRFDPSNPNAQALLVKKEEIAAEKEKRQEFLAGKELLRKRRKEQEELRQQKEKLRAQFKETIEAGTEEPEKVIQIQGESWRKLIDTEKPAPAEEEEDNGGFFLSFGDEEAAAPEMPPPTEDEARATQKKAKKAQKKAEKLAMKIELGKKREAEAEALAEQGAKAEAEADAIKEKALKQDKKDSCSSQVEKATAKDKKEKKKAAEKANQEEKKEAKKEIKQTAKKEAAKKEAKKENKEDIDEGLDLDAADSDGSAESDEDEEAVKNSKGEKVDFEDLPNRIKKRIEKRKRKKQELRQKQKLAKISKIDYDKHTDVQIAERYQKIYPERSLDDLAQYVHYQRLVHEAKTRGKKK